MGSCRRCNWSCRRDAAAWGLMIDVGAEESWMTRGVVVMQGDGAGVEECSVRCLGDDSLTSQDVRDDSLTSWEKDSALPNITPAPLILRYLSSRSPCGTPHSNTCKSLHPSTPMNPTIC